MKKHPPKSENFSYVAGYSLNRFRAPNTYWIYVNISKYYIITI
ncbi:hypothetical protein [Bacillus paramycoides]|nr:hypothetical protein [Bacillus paramycoides]